MVGVYKQGGIRYNPINLGTLISQIDPLGKIRNIYSTLIPGKNIETRIEACAKTDTELNQEHKEISYPSNHWRTVRRALKGAVVIGLVYTFMASACASDDEPNGNNGGGNVQPSITIDYFTADPTSGIVPLTVNYSCEIEVSGGDPKIEADFDGDGTIDEVIDSSGECAAQNTFNQTGTYSSTLRAYIGESFQNADASASETVQVEVLPAPTDGNNGQPSITINYFTANPTRGIVPLTVNYDCDVEAIGGDPNIDIDYDGDRSVDAVIDVVNGACVSSNTFNQAGTFDSILSAYIGASDDPDASASETVQVEVLPAPTSEATLTAIASTCENYPDDGTNCGLAPYTATLNLYVKANIANSDPLPNVYLNSGSSEGESQIDLSTVTDTGGSPITNSSIAAGVTIPLQHLYNEVPDGQRCNTYSASLRVVNQTAEAISALGIKECKPLIVGEANLINEIVSYLTSQYGMTVEEDKPQFVFFDFETEQFIELEFDKRLNDGTNNWWAEANTAEDGFTTAESSSLELYVNSVPGSLLNISEGTVEEIIAEIERLRTLFYSNL